MQVKVQTTDKKDGSFKVRIDLDVFNKDELAYLLVLLADMVKKEKEEKVLIESK